MLAQGTTTQQPGTLTPLLHLLQHTAKPSSFWREKHILQLLPTQLGLWSPTIMPSTARAQRHICPWRVQMEFPAGKPYPETIHRAWCTCLCILNTDLPAAISAKQCPCCPGLDCEHPGRVVLLSWAGTAAAAANSRAASSPTLF